MDSRKQSTQRRQNSVSFTSIARDRQFDPVSEIVHRSSGTSQRRQNDIDLFHQRRSERTFNETHNRVVADRISGPEHAQAIADVLHDSGETLSCDSEGNRMRENHGHPVCFPKTAKKQVRFELKLQVHDVPIEDRTSDWMLMAADRFRFKRRIRQMEGILGPVLQAQMKKDC